MPPAGYPAFLQYLQSGRVRNFPETYPDLYQRSVLGFLREMKKQID